MHLNTVIFPSYIFSLFPHFFTLITYIYIYYIDHRGSPVISWSFVFVHREQTVVLQKLRHHETTPSCPLFFTFFFSLYIIDDFQYKISCSVFAMFRCLLECTWQLIIRRYYNCIIKVMSGNNAVVCVQTRLFSTPIRAQPSIPKPYRYHRVPTAADPAVYQPPAYKHSNTKTLF